MKLPLKLIIGLGNPGQSFYYHRHSIGFRILDALADKHSAVWQEKKDMAVTQISLHGNTVYLVKPQTYMNNSGDILPTFTKKGIKPEEILVVHDELEIPFSKVALKQGGSARGHNGLKSIISRIGDNFHRLRIGIGRPANREDVPDYVLQDFSEREAQIVEVIQKSLDLIDRLDRAI